MSFESSGPALPPTASVGVGRVSGVEYVLGGAGLHRWKETCW